MLCNTQHAPAAHLPQQQFTWPDNGCVQEAFAKYVDVNSVAESLAAPKAARLTPKAFMHSITQRCRANPQHIVLPEVLCIITLI